MWDHGSRIQRDFQDDVRRAEPFVNLATPTGHIDVHFLSYLSFLFHMVQDAGLAGIRQEIRVKTGDGDICIFPELSSPQ